MTNNLDNNLGSTQTWRDLLVIALRRSVLSVGDNKDNVMTDNPITQYKNADGRKCWEVEGVVYYSKYAAKKALQRLEIRDYDDRLHDSDIEDDKAGNTWSG